MIYQFGCPALPTNDGVISAGAGAGQPYLISSVTKLQRPLFMDFWLTRKAILALRHMDHLGASQTCCYVFMPDQLFWLFILPAEQQLSKTVRQLQLLTSHAAGTAIWQRGFRHHLLRRGDDLRPVARQLISNPVRAGLVSRIGDYPHWDAGWL